MLATATGSTRENANRNVYDSNNDNNIRFFRTQKRADLVTVVGIRATILAEASKGIIGRKSKLANFFTSQLAVASDHPVRGLGQDVGANVCNDHLIDPLLDSETSL